MAGAIEIYRPRSLSPTGKEVDLEEWKSVPGYEGYYEVSNMGRVRSVDRWIEYPDGRMALHKGVELSQKNRSGKYKKVGLWKDNRVKYVNANVLVLMAFVGNRPEPHHHACHKNGDPLDNRLENLEWGTPSKNARDRVRHGRDKDASKTHCPQNHEYTKENTSLSKEGHRKCKKCHAAREYAKRHPELNMTWLEILELRERKEDA